MPNPLKLLLAFTGLWIGTLIAVGVATIGGAAIAGPTVRGGERAVVALAVFDGVVGLVALAVFTRLSGLWSSRLGRGIWVASFLCTEIVTLALLGFATLVILNR